jgi:hypothetical protein
VLVELRLQAGMSFLAASGSGFAGNLRGGRRLFTTRDRGARRGGEPRISEGEAASVSTGPDAAARWTEGEGQDR